MKSGIGERIKLLHEILPEGVELVAVSKFQPVEAIKEAYSAGQRIFGESRVREMLEKKKELPSDIKWHFIGHLQTNKVRQLIGAPYLIESVDSIRLLKLIDEESGRKCLKSRLLLQIHVAKEETKFGFLPEEVREFFLNREYIKFKNSEICGLMAMASNTDNMERVAEDFRQVKHLFDEIKSGYGDELPEFKTLSMGMSGDWKIAVEEGSDMIRIGSYIFGDRI